MKQHIFKYIEQGVYLVKCLKTNGEFCSNCWKNDKVKQNNCVCCNRVIK